MLRYFVEKRVGRGASFRMFRVLQRSTEVGDGRQPEHNRVETKDKPKRFGEEARARPPKIDQKNDANGADNASKGTPDAGAQQLPVRERLV